MCLSARNPLLPVVLLAASACTTVVEMPLPTIESLPGVEVERSAQPAPQEGAFLGVTVEERLAGSLEELELVEGLFVTDVERGSPAEAAGLRPGDRLVSVDGEPLRSVDQWRAWLAGREPGDRVVLGVERDGGIHEVEVELAPRRRGTLPPAHRFVDRLRLRAVFESAPAGGTTGARVVSLLPGSPLAEAGVREGDVVAAVDGEPVRSANGLVVRLARLGEGERVRLDLMRGERRFHRSVRTFRPPRRLVALAVRPLFTWRRDPAGTEASFHLLDLWLISLYGYEREGPRVRHSLLGLAVAEWGEGELEEEGS